MSAWGFFSVGAPLSQRRFFWYSPHILPTGKTAAGWYECIIHAVALPMFAATGLFMWKPGLSPSETLHNAMAAFGLFTLYALAASFILPEGINASFASISWVWFLILTVLALLGLAYYRVSGREERGGPRKRTVEAFAPGDFLLLLLPMTPIVQYVISNQDVLGLGASVLIIATFLLVAFALGIVVPLLLQRWGARRVFMCVGLSFSFLVFNMASLAHDFNWHLMGNFPVQLGIVIAVFLLALLAYSADRKFLYAGVTAFFVFNTVAAFPGVARIGTEEDEPSELYSHVEGKVLRHAPDIFLLIYDSYVGNETTLQYGIDNSAQEEFLRQNGFHLYEGTYSTGSRSVHTMSRVLDVVPEFPGNGRIPPAGGGAVQDILQSEGYRTLGIFANNYFLRGVDSRYDKTVPSASEAEHDRSSYEGLVRAIAEGEFRFDLDFNDFGTLRQEEWKLRVLSVRSNEPRFLYAHDLLPSHSQNSGQCQDNEIERFELDLQLANMVMTADVEAITAHNPDAIVIIAGDHGPYLTGDCYNLLEHDKDKVNRLHVQERYGSFLAIRWPDEARVQHEAIHVLQDVFPVIFSYLYDDEAVLDARIERVTDGFTTAGVLVRDGIIEGGKDDGKPLFDRVGIKEPVSPTELDTK